VDRAIDDAAFILERIDKRWASTVKAMASLPTIAMPTNVDCAPSDPVAGVERRNAQCTCPKFARCLLTRELFPDPAKEVKFFTLGFHRAVWRATHD